MELVLQSNQCAERTQTTANMGLESWTGEMTAQLREIHVNIAQLSSVHMLWERGFAHGPSKSAPLNSSQPDSG